jgi:hypothetical protein
MRSPNTQRRYEELRKVREAIKRLRTEDPAKYNELLKRARDYEYDRQQRLKELEEERRKLEAERHRRLRYPVVVGLPEVPRVRGVLAFRVWDFEAGGLRSTVRRYFWKEVNFADHVPTASNQSGFYCIKLTGLGVLSTGAAYFGMGRQGVSGFVELLGHVVEHEDGVLRAEVARLVCLFVTPEGIEASPDIVSTLRRLYPVTPVYVLLPEQLADVVMREVLRQRYLNEG